FPRRYKASREVIRTRSINQDPINQSIRTDQSIRTRSIKQDPINQRGPDQSIRTRSIKTRLPRQE
ncbi:unnamed protein product, partial [Arctogadus glacialis]